MTFEHWWDRPEGCGSTPDTYKGWENSCRVSYEAGAADSKEEIESLRQRLILKEHQYDVMKASAEVLAEQCDKMRQQLETSQKREVMLREALETCEVGDFSTGHVIYPSFDEKLVNEALAATADIDGLILCHANPVGQGLFDTEGTCYSIGQNRSSMCVGGKAFRSEPLYRAWEPKP